MRIFTFLLAIASILPVHAEPLQGDAEAVALVEKMIDRMGGSAIWSRTRTLHLVYNGWRTNPDEAMIEHAWRDLAKASSRTEFHARSFTVIRVFTPETGWLKINGEVRAMTEQEHKNNIAFDPKDFYTMIHRFATGDQDLRLAFEEPKRVRVSAAAGQDLGWWEIDDSGQVLRWGAEDEGEQLEYVYLPFRQFGNISFPAGGAATDGFWRWTYDVVEVSIEPIPVSMKMPETDG